MYQKKMHKIAALLLVLVLVLSLFAACGQGQDASAPTGDTREITDMS